jgi:hypothetical protein
VFFVFLDFSDFYFFAASLFKTIKKSLLCHMSAIDVILFRMNNNNTPLRVLPLEVLSMPFDVDGKSGNISYIITQLGEILVAAGRYVVYLTGCADKDASMKIASVYSKLPHLHHADRALLSHCKVINMNLFLCSV